MEVRFVDASGAHQHRSGAVLSLLDRDDGFLWVDVPLWDDEAQMLLSALGCHPRVLEDCARRNHVPTVHGTASTTS